MDATLVAAQVNLTLVVPLVLVSMIVVYGVYRFRFYRSKNDNRKEQEVRKIFY